VGTKINLNWIPSPAGIKGNEIADQLANSGRTADDGETMTHIPNMAEKLFKIKNRDTINNLEKLRNSSTNQAVTNRNTMGIVAWHAKKNRRIQSALFRLRSGHNKLNGRTSKWNPDTQPECTHGCPQKEDPTHVLLQCPHYSTARMELAHALEKLKLPLEVPTVTGINFSIPKHTQYKIARALIRFIINTKIIERL
jgi:hypothetical protein